MTAKGLECDVGCDRPSASNVHAQMPGTIRLQAASAMLAFMKQSTVLLALTLLHAACFAKCVEVTYVFEGKVQRASGKPASGALVGVSWIEQGQAAGPAIAVADANGAYRLLARFRPSDDMPLSGAACTERLSRMSVVAYAGDRRSSPKEIPVAGLNQRLPLLTIDEPAG